MTVYRKVFFFCKTLRNETPSNLLNMTPTSNKKRKPRNPSNLPLFNKKHKYLKSIIFRSPIIEQNGLDSLIRLSNTLKLKKKRILIFTRPKTNSIYDTDNPLRIKHFIKLMGGIVIKRNARLDVVFKILQLRCIRAVKNFPIFSIAHITIFKD